jgi:signal transduction histidine kinase
MKDDDLYARYQTLAAAISVLLHDLRNPLHSATLLVEAMGSRNADVDSLRGKLRGQFGKLEALIGEASDAIKDLSLDARVEDVPLDELLRSSAKAAPALSASDIEIVMPASVSQSRVSVDPVLITRAVAEIGGTLFDRRSPASAPARMPIPLAVDEADAAHVKLVIGDWIPVNDDAAIKAPFNIAGGGIRMALARTLAQFSGATIRLEQSPEGSIRYSLLLRRAA